MSWLGEQFSSFTGKLTDFTKDVLNDNGENSVTDGIQSQNGILSANELLQLCKEKDIRLELLMNEKELLEKSIEELDQQHQEAIDELLFLKNQAVKENAELKEKFAKQEQNVLTNFSESSIRKLDFDLYSHGQHLKLVNQMVSEAESENINYLKNFNLIDILLALDKSCSENKLSNQIKWLENQKDLLGVDYNEDESSVNSLRNKINNYINFFQAVMINKESLSPVISEISSVIDILLSDNLKLNEALKSGGNSDLNIQGSLDKSGTEITNNSSQELLNSSAITLKGGRCDFCLQMPICNSKPNNKLSILTQDSSCQTLISSGLHCSLPSISVLSQTEGAEECRKCQERYDKEVTMIKELQENINNLEQEKLNLQSEISYLKSIQSKNSTSVEIQTNNEYICKCKFLQSELAAVQESLCEKERLYNIQQKEVSNNLNKLKKEIKSKEILLQERDEIIHSLGIEIKSSKEKINSLTMELNSIKRKTDYAKDADTFETCYSENNAESSNTFKNSNNMESKGNLYSAKEIALLQEKLKQLDLEKGKLLCVLTEKTQECSSLKSEVHKLTNIVASEKQALLKLQQDNCELKESRDKSDPELTKEAVQKLSRLIRDKDFEIESLKQKNSTLTTLIQDASSVPEHLQSLIEEKENLSKQINVFKSDRDNIMFRYNTIDKECRQYAAEVKRLKSVLSQQKEQFDLLEQKHSSVTQQYEEKQKTLINTQNEMIALKQRVTDLEQQQIDFKEKYSELLNKINSDTMIQITKEELNEKQSQIEHLMNNQMEKDHLIQEKDCLIHDLSQQIKKLKLEFEQQQNNVSTLETKTAELTNKLKENYTTIEKFQNEKDAFELRFQDKTSELMLLKEMNERLNMALKEKEFAIQSMTEKISSLSQYINSDHSASETTDINQILADSESMFSKAQNLYRERDETLLALNQSRQENQSLRNEIQRMKSSEIHLKNELERLRAHLLQIEENYTNEALKAEEREKELRDELIEVKRRAEISNTAVVDTSQRASIQIASLQEQLTMIANQRDQALEQVSTLEDKVLQHSTSISKLQLVLEQMQRGNERKIKEAEKKWQVALENQQKLCKELVDKLHAKELQLEESSQALEAASRLSEQLDAKEEIIANLKSELSKVESKIKSTAQEIDTIKSDTEGKVDRVVMKSLVLGYFSTPPGQKSEVIRLLARVLDFNQEEMERAGIVVRRNTGRSEQRGIISSLFSRLPSLSSSEQSRHSAEKSFTTLFVQFLENESQPIVPMPFPAEKMAQEVTFKTHPNKKSQANQNKSSPGKSPLLLDIDSTFPTFTPIPAVEYSQSPAPSILREVLE